MRLNEENYLEEILINGKGHIYFPENQKVAFTDKNNEKIYLSMMSLLGENQNIDILTVSQRLKKQGLLDKIGGLKYLASLVIQS